jgi:hypothetical protein
MMPPNAEELLRVWEEQRDAHPVRRAVGVLATAAPEIGWDGWMRAPIGARDDALLGLLERLFGSELHTVAACPQCGERIESTFRASDVGGIGGDARAPAASAPSLRLHADGFDVEYRLPCSDDLLQVAAEAGGTAVDVQLLRRCVSRAQQGDAIVDAAALPNDVVERITDGMAEHDPGADVRVRLECPVCAAVWELHFDIVSYFLSELDDWAYRILADIHVLASAYGWRESDVLALSPPRRRFYLEMVGA